VIGYDWPGPSASLLTLLPNRRLGAEEE
jgi:hypothetical protein